MLEDLPSRRPPCRRFWVALLSQVAMMALLALQGGCAMRFIPKAPEQGPAPEGRVIVTGRINYVIDGNFVTPYGHFRPDWLPPSMSAVRLEDGNPYHAPEVEKKDGSFRWALLPGTYWLTRVGSGPAFQDGFIAWPRLLLCVPNGAREIYVGHLRLEGRRYAEPLQVAGSENARLVHGVRYAPVRVEDESEKQPTRPAQRLLATYRKDLPIGEGLVKEFQADQLGLANRAGCKLRSEE
jgi:hypothetical protein